MNKYILLRAEDAENWAGVVEDVRLFIEQESSPDDPIVSKLEQMQKLLSSYSIEVSEEARDFVMTIRSADPEFSDFRISLDEAAAMLTTRDKEIERRVRAEKAKVPRLMLNDMAFLSTPNGMMQRRTLERRMKKLREIASRYNVEIEE